MIDSQALQTLLESVAAGAIAPQQALDQLRYLDTEAIGDFARIDHHRQLRTGFPEVIWGQDKTTEQILTLFRAYAARNQAAIATRIDPDRVPRLQAQLPDLRYDPIARIASLQPTSIQSRLGRLGVVCAGTSDLPVAEEAAVVAELWGFRVDRIRDVGVAGLHRLLAERSRLDQADVLIVVAGMEGALPSVIAGLVDCPIIAVPTSVGYGASFQGLAALLSMLNSCAPGMAVVNIDNGFGAAQLAGRILRRLHRPGRSDTP